MYMQGLRIKEIMQEKGITQKKLAEDIGVAEISLSRSLRGNPTLDTLERIATALNVPITELFSTDKQDLCGHVEYKGVVYTIKTRSDLENLLKIVS